MTRSGEHKRRFEQSAAVRARLLHVQTHTSVLPNITKPLVNYKTESQKLCRLSWLARLGACSAYATFCGSFTDFRVRILGLSLRLRKTCNPFTSKHASKHACALHEGKCI